MSWLYSRALVEEYSEGTYSDGELSAPSKSSHMPRAYLPLDKMTAFSRLSRFGMTFAPLTDARGKALLTSYLAASRARTSALQEKARASPARGRASGKRWRGLLVKYGPDGYSSKIVLCSEQEDCEKFSAILPNYGMMRDGECSALPASELPTNGKDSGLWPTPLASMADRGGRGDLLAIVRGKANKHSGMWPAPTANRRDGTTIPSLLGAVRLWPTPQARDFRSGDNPGSPRAIRKQEQGWSPNLNDAVKLWPTPRTAGMCGRTGNWNQLKDKCENIEEARKMGAGNGGQLNPTWVEWLMGWPLGWTDLKPLAMGKFRQWLRAHGKS